MPVSMTVNMANAHTAMPIPATGVAGPSSARCVAIVIEGPPVRPRRHSSAVAGLVSARSGVLLATWAGALNPRQF